MANYVLITAINSQWLFVFVRNNLRIQIEIGGIMIWRQMRGEIDIVSIILSNRAVIRKIDLTICFAVEYP